MKLELQEPWNESIVSEQADLKRKYIKLVEYINSERFYNLSENEQKLLNNQKILMEAYIKILSTKLYDDIDNAIITDLSWLQLMAGVFGNCGNSFSNNIQYKENSKQLEKTEAL